MTEPKPIRIPFTTDAIQQVNEMLFWERLPENRRYYWRNAQYEYFQTLDERGLIVDVFSRSLEIPPVDP